MYSTQEAKILTERNRHRIRELVRVSFGLGVNLTSPKRLKGAWALGIVSILLIMSSSGFLYGNWCIIVRYVDNIQKMIEAICIGVQVIGTILKLVYYVLRQRKFASILHTIESYEILSQIEIFHRDFPNSEKLKAEIDKIMEKNWKNIRSQLLVFTYSCIANIFYYWIVAIAVNANQQLKHTPNCSPKLPYPAVFPSWEEKCFAFPYYHLEMIVSGSATYLVGMCAIIFECIFIVVSSHCVALIDVLNMMFKYATSPQVPKERRTEYLRSCIHHYQRTLNYYDDISDLYKHVSLIQVLVSMLVLGMLLFQISLGLVSYESSKLDLLRTFLYFAAASYQIYIYCYNGQRLTSASDEITNALYSCEWYNESIEFKHLLMMTMMRCNNNCVIGISSFSTMSLTTLVSLARTSGSYFLLLRNLSE